MPTSMPEMTHGGDHGNNMTHEGTKMPMMETTHNHASHTKGHEATPTAMPEMTHGSNHNSSESHPMESI